MILACYPRSGP